MPAPRVRAAALAALLAGAGASHFAVPGIYDAMIPKVLPGPPRAWTVGSGVAEIAVAAAVLAPPTRRHGALAAVGLFVGVLPANVKMVIDARTSDSIAYKAGTVLRLPLQAPLIAWALRVRRDA
ncbi:MAG: DoxX family protein [Jatrophihabitans sp.]